MNRILSISIVFLFAGYSYQGYAQLQGQLKIDSLLKVLPSQKEDSNKINVLNQLAITYTNINPDEGIKYARQGVKLAEELDLKEFIGKENNAIGINYESKSEYPSALEYYFKALRSYEELNVKSEKLGDVLSNIGTVYLNQENFDKALEYYFKALPIYERSARKNGLANTLNGIGTVYADQKNYLKSFEYYTKAIAINEDIGNTRGVAEIFGNLGDNYKDQKNYPKALSYYTKALNIYELLGDKDGIGTNYGNMGKCFLAIAEDTATIFADDSLISKDRKKNIKSAINNLTNGIRLSREFGDVANLIEFSRALSEADRQNNDINGALENLELFITLKDSIFSVENSRKIAGLETQREHELKEKVERFEELENRNEGLAIFAAFVILFVIIFIVLRNNKAQKRSNKLLAAEKRKSDDLLLNILPAEVADELKETGSSEAKYFENVTVMFTDFVGFTKFADSLTAGQLVAELHTCFKAFDAICTKYNIEKIKTIGDAYMAISGLPVPNDNHAVDMVNAAIEIKRFMYERKQALGDKTFEIRIGIHSGNVVAGIVGVKKFAYDIWGDTVNTAARMEQNSEQGRINISEATYQLVKHKIDCTYRGEIQAKNKGMLRMYFVVG